MEDHARGDAGWRSRLHAGAPWLALAVIGSAALAWIGLAEFGWNDYDSEARASVDALVHGHLSSFFQLAPVYGGSLLERAPFALLANALGGGDLTIYRMLALPCLLAAVALGLWLVAQMDKDGASPLSRALALGLCTVNPLTLLALEIGHAEELLGGALCVGAVLCAARGRALWAAIALGLAIANKQWALLAIGPVLIALPSRRVLCTSIAASVAAGLALPFALLGPSQLVTTVHAAATSAGRVFPPWQVWWFFGRPRHLTTHVSTVHLSERLTPHWVEVFSHPLILAVSLPLSGLAWAWMRHRQTESSGAPRGAESQADRRSVALVLLSLLLLLRFMLDPWNNVYYPLPFVLALLAWETISLRRSPLLALGVTVVVWGGCHWMEYASENVKAVFFLAWTLPLAAGLLLACRRGATNAGVALFDDGQLLGKLRQHLMPLGGDGHEILDANAHGALQVDAGLDRHHLAGR